MIELILLAYEFLAVLAPFTITYLVLGRWYASQGIVGVEPFFSKTAEYRFGHIVHAKAVAPQKTGYETSQARQPHPQRKAITSLKAGYETPQKARRQFYQHLLFALYVFAVLYATGAGTLHDALRFGPSLTQINLIPFSQDHAIWQCLLNIVMFMPLGFLAAKLWPTIDKLGVMILYGFSFSLLIELSQLFNIRSTDVDDLIMNTFGTILGLLLYRLLFRKSRSERKMSGYRLEQPLAIEPAVYLGVMFIGHFLLFDGMGAAMLLLGHQGLPMIVN